uniref:NADH-ubiquinone oxidoreductase chain 4L n=1 Tax=Adelphocoris fasciaticollis TaxID=323752 RepID=A0A342LEQ2_9HEMI|nr:NADH dehydrogenase subunit 4L [Adelphocoris fasciaticollis]
MFMYFMYYFINYFVFFMFFSGLLLYCSMRKHLLLTLLSLEYLVLCIYMMMVFFCMIFVGNMYMLLAFLTFSVCESVLGLSILVSIIRSYGNDHIYSLFMLW